MSKIKRTAKKLQEEYDDIASGKKSVGGSCSYKRSLVIRKKAKEKAEEMKKFLEKQDSADI